MFLSGWTTLKLQHINNPKKTNLGPSDMGMAVFKTHLMILQMHRCDDFEPYPATQVKQRMWVKWSSHLARMTANDVTNICQKSLNP